MESWTINLKGINDIPFVKIGIIFNNEKEALDYLNNCEFKELLEIIKIEH